jgi:hypothetical protein
MHTAEAEEATELLPGYSNDSKIYDAICLESISGMPCSTCFLPGGWVACEAVMEAVTARGVLADEKETDKLQVQ